MDDNLNVTPETSAADQDAAEVAFASGFVDDAGGLPSLAEPSADNTDKTKAAVEPKSEPVAPAVAEADPYAGLPEPVRKALAAIPSLENELRRTTGQVRALQSAHDRDSAARRAADENVPRSKAHEQVAETLPEVLTTIDEIVTQRLRQHAPAPQAAADGDDRLPDERRLDEGFPQWREIGSSTDFKLWAAAQHDAKVIQTTGDMVTFMGAITRFEKHRSAHQAAAQEAQKHAALRTSRMDASVTPTRGAARRPSASQTEEDAFAEGFKSRGA